MVADERPGRQPAAMVVVVIVALQSYLQIG
jgi:hypothetical protein